MSSRYVRTTVRNWLKQGNTPFFDTVNLDQDPTDTVWCTVDWGFATKTPETYCNDVEEGGFDVVFISPPGIGDDAVLQQAEAEMDLLMLRVDTSGRVALIGFDPPIHFSTDQGHFCVSFSVSYEYRA